MTATLLSLISLFVSGFMVMLASGLINILIPTRLSVEGVSADNIGLIMSMFAIGLLLGGLYARRLILRVGHIRVYAACAAGLAFAILSCYLWMNEWLWAVMRIVTGFCIASTNIVVDGWLSERATSNTRARILATNQMVIYIAMFLGAFVVNIAPTTAPTLYIIAGLLMCCGVVPIAMSRVSAPEVEDIPSMPVRQLFGVSAIGVTSVFICGVAFGSVLSMLVVYGEAKGIVGFNASLLLGAAIMGGFLLQFPIGYLADRYDRRMVMFYSVLLSLLCCMMIPWIVALDLFVVLLLMVGFSSGILSSFYPLGLAEAFDKLRQSEMGAAIGAMIIVYAIGGTIGPYVAGLVMEQLGDNYFFVFLALVHALFAGLIAYWVKKPRTVPVEQQEAFVAQGASGLVSTELDPRIEQVEEQPSLTVLQQAAVEMAQSNPALAIEMVSLIARSAPEQLEDVITAVASVDEVDSARLYAILQDSVADDPQSFAPAIVGAGGEPSSDLISAVFEDAESDQIAELAASMTEAAPEQSLEIIEAATEAVVDEHPEMVVDIAEAYLSNVSDNLEDMRYADRLADDSDKTVTEIVSMIADVAPEQAMDVAVAAVEAVPEAASGLVEALHESDAVDDMVSGLDDKPDSDPV
ncbi:MAG: MFS transporter [Amphritea sp.]|nr:MFS transporter [Amphritea sp.]